MMVQEEMDTRWVMLKHQWDAHRMQPTTSIISTTTMYLKAICHGMWMYIVLGYWWEINVLLTNRNGYQWESTGINGIPMYARWEHTSNHQSYIEGYYGMQGHNKKTWGIWQLYDSCMTVVWQLYDSFLLSDTRVTTTVMSRGWAEY